MGKLVKKTPLQGVNRKNSKSPVLVLRKIPRLITLVGLNKFLTNMISTENVENLSKSMIFYRLPPY